MSIELCVFDLSSFTFRTVKLFCWIHNKYDYLKLITNTIFDHYHNLNNICKLLQIILLFCEKIDSLLNM